MKKISQQKLKKRVFYMCLNCGFLRYALKGSVLTRFNAAFFRSRVLNKKKNNQIKPLNFLVA
jgi:hypothetical protein